MDAYEAKKFRPGDSAPLQAGFHTPIANQQSALTIDPQCLQAAVRSVLEDSSFRSAMISIALVDDPAIHEINRQYLNHDYPTDVISFVLNTDADHLEGELVVSTETAIRNADQYGWPAADELLLYVIHGTLHLVGYLDKNPADKSAMVAAEAAQLQKLGVPLPADQSRWQPTHHDEAPTS
jgi:probable rRNA maturation factor